MVVLVRDFFFSGLFVDSTMALSYGLPLRNSDRLMPNT
ncbi:Hypothetical protein NRBB56_0459 [Bifidobacterium breve]|nr:Hypothetical protein NRBB56_0459 [Bifidobacterium breve]